MTISDLKEYHVVPYKINGIELYAVERTNGYIDKYCNSKEDAEHACDALNNWLTNAIKANEG